MYPRTAPALLFVLLLLALPASGRAQTAEVTAEEENLRQEPLGKRLATVNRGTRLEVRGSEGRWRQVVLSGWIWTPSVGAVDREGHDLVVTADGGENLRRSPGPEAEIAARLLEGFLLQRVDEKGNWTQVRRTAWMWAPSLSISGEEAGAPADGGDGADAGGADDDGEDADPGRGASGGPDRLAVEGGPAPLFVSPDGDTLAVARPGAALSVLARKGNWARVRLEGWVRVDRVAPGDSASPADDLAVDDLTSNPEQYQGRRVRWELQFISLERAEPERSDFYEGEPFILARPVDGSGGFVYVAVPPERIQRVEALEPLQRIRITGRVRTGRSSLMGAPVLELIELVPLSGGEDEGDAGG
jgi:hypothetical protein